MKYVVELPVPLSDLEKLLNANAGQGRELMSVVVNNQDRYVTIWKVPPEKEKPRMGGVGGR